jgi:hypothetical protein
MIRKDHLLRTEVCVGQCLVEHKHAISSWLMVRLTRDTMETVLKIETDLVLNAQTLTLTATQCVAYSPECRNISGPQAYCQADIETIVD